MKLKLVLLSSLVAAHMMDYIKDVRNIKQNKQNFRGDSVMRQYLKGYNTKLDNENGQPNNKMQNIVAEDKFQRKLNKLYSFSQVSERSP